jgi:hypothetical protein
LELLRRVICSLWLVLRPAKGRIFECHSRVMVKKIVTTLYQV